MKERNLYIVISILAIVIISLSACAQKTVHAYNNNFVSTTISVYNNMIAYCEKQNSVEHEMVTGEVDELFSQQQKLISIRDEMQKQKGYDKDMLKIINNEIADIDMMFGEYKNGVSSIPEKHYLFFSSYLKQTNVNLKVFLDNK
ncbi:MAG: hypothetical protein CVU50_01430 [Candidatus Cloacimonetes bacterium HGW-Cloacimonetes-3]|nr:MAG: hypothetical protein CVU50_01430 [Candidatus Cloacimonetes bacterium HGW-Cloacimonetes-3]